MPASRSARAMILAPRSWPSRPGLATTTRILLWVLEAVEDMAAGALSIGLGRPGASGAGRAPRGSGGQALGGGEASGARGAATAGAHDPSHRGEHRTGADRGDHLQSPRKPIEVDHLPAFG